MRITVDMVQANKELTSLAGKLGITLRDLMYDQARLLCQDAILTVAPGPKGGPAEQKKAGEGAIRTDLNKMFWVPDNDDALQAWNDLVAERPEIYFFTNTGKKRIRRDAMKFAAAKELHKRHRDKKTGRVKFRGNPQDFAGGKYIIDRKTLKSYYNQTIKKIGQLKAGFIPAGEWLESITSKRMSGRNVPAWVRKQAAKMGSKVDGLNKKTGRGFIQISNSVPYADRAISQSTVQYLESKRQRDLREQAIKRLRKVTKLHNSQFARAA